MPISPMPPMEGGCFPSPIADMSVITRLCFRYAFSRQNRHRGTSIRITVGLSLCLFAILIVLAFMQALQRNQFEDIRTYESFDLQLGLNTSDLEEARSIAEELAKHEDIDAAFVYGDIPVITQGDDGSSVAGRIRGIEAKGRFLDKVYSYRGSLYKRGMLSSSYANSRVHPMNDEIKVMLLRKGRQATIVPSQRTMVIGSLYYTTSYEFDQSTFLCDVETLLNLNADAPLKIGIYTSESVEEVKKSIIQLGYDQVATWKEVNASLYGAMELEQKMMALLLSLMVLVILVHIRSSSRRLLLAKQREVAMLRSMGTTKRGVQAVFLLQSLIVALLGCALGVVLSYAVVALYPSISMVVYRNLGAQLDLRLRGKEVVFLVSTILLCSVLASYIGTRKLLEADIMEMFAHDEVR